MSTIPRALGAMPGAWMLERRRADALPEFFDYRDTGCSVHPACLTCPLPKCRYDTRGGERAYRLAARDPLIRAAREAGESIEDIAERFKVSRRTVFRVLALA